MLADPVHASAQAIPGAALTIEKVSAGYGGRPVVHGTSIDVLPGEVVAIVGPNGSGKSTLLKSVVGVAAVLSGRIAINGVDITSMASEDVARVGVGYVPQVDDVFAPLSVKENLEMGGYLLPRRHVQARIEEVLEYFPKLATMLNRRGGQLSGGERKMLAMGRVLMLRPALFVLDEPTANLAPIMANELLQHHIQRLAEDGATVLIVEQRAKAVLEIADHAYVLASGRVRMSGTPAQLIARPDFVDSFLGGAR